MKNILLLFILLTLIRDFTFPQNRHNIDSIQNKLALFEANKKSIRSKSHSLSDSTKANLLYWLSVEFWGNNHDTAMILARQALFLSQEIGYKKGIALSYNSIGSINMYQGNNQVALEYYQKSLKIFEEIRYKRGIAVCYKNIGLIYYNRGNYSDALKNDLKSLQLLKEAGDKKNIGATYSGIGQIYQLQGFYPEALKNQLMAIKIQEEIGDKRNLVYSYNTVGSINMAQGNYSEALKNNLVALKISKETSFKLGIGSSYDNIGFNYYKQKKYPEALKSYQDALKVYEEIDYKQGIADSYYYKSLIKSEQGDFSEALKNFFIALRIYEEIGLKFDIVNSYNEIGSTYERQGNLKEALKYEKKGLSLAVEIGSKSGKKEAYGGLALVYAKLQNYKAAYENEVLFKKFYDTLYNNENQKKLTGLQMQYEFDKKQQADSIQHAGENTINLMNLHRQKVFTGLVISGFVLVVLLLFFVYRNFTNQRKATAEMAIARQRAEKSEKFKEQFLANMSHEIRTPMNAVIGMTRLVLDSPLNEKQKFYLEGIRKSSDTLLHIINDILDLSKIEAGKMDLESIDFSIAELLGQVKLTLLHKAEENGLELIVNIDRNVPDVIMGDPLRLNQVLMNLAGNAIKFTEKGSVTLSVRRPQSAGRSPESLIFSITDTGIGIPKDKLDSIFESFSQVHTSDTRRYGGTGLGLTISKQLVALMDGKISVESREGMGTTFSFEINCPAGSAERLKAQKSADQIDGSILDGLKILLADDNEYNRIVTRDTLKSKAKVEIWEAVNGRDAIARLIKRDFDVVLMDVQMPMMDGYEATRCIRERFPSPKNQIKVIALTASVIRTDLDKCWAAGMNDYVPKPFKVYQLISAIAKATGREIRFSERVIPEIKPGSTTNSVLTDLGYLEKFCEGDSERMKKYIDMFLVSAPSLIEKINLALSNNDWPEIAIQMHGYKTNLFMMGMNRTKDLSLKIESQCREEIHSNNLRENILTFMDQIEQATNEL